MQRARGGGQALVLVVSSGGSKGQGPTAMCGIVGYFSADGAVDETLADHVRIARDRLTHRGPDDAGLYCSPDGCCVLGHRRLSIQDASSRGRQPMPNEDDTLWMVCNGEVYNFVALREELREAGHVFRSGSDTEVILHLYERDGPAMVHRLDGMFAFVIYDAVNRRLFGARDRLGVKPVYLFSSGRRFAFASEPKALLALPDVSRNPRLSELPGYFTFNCVPGSRTLFRDIEKLEPGVMFSVDSDGQCRHAQYWVPKIRERGAADAVERAEIPLASRLREATRKRLVAELPCGALLSGGVDSSLIVALMSEALAEPVKTFTVGYPGDEADPHSDLHFARLVARRFRTDHHEAVLTPTDIAHGLDDVLPALADDPVGAPSVLANALLARHVKRSGVTVVQVGEGADELFCGYPSVHRRWRLHRRVSAVASRVPKVAARLLARALGPALHMIGNPSLFGSMDSGISEQLGRFGRGEHLYWGTGVLFATDDRERLLGARPPSSNPYSHVRRQIEKATGFSGYSYLDQLALIDILVGLPERLLMRVDKANMLFSVEAREPFLDPAVVEMALGIPPRLRAPSPKSVLKAVAGTVLPSEVLNRRKVGFPTMPGVFLSPTVLPLVRESVTCKRFLALTGLDRNRVEIFLRDAGRGGTRFFYHLWSIFVLSLWFRHWVEGDR